MAAVVEDGRQLVETARRLRPDVIVADITMPHLNGIDALVQLKHDNPEVRVVFLTMHKDAAYARRALEAGARGYVLKHSAQAELFLAVRAALDGNTFISPTLAAEVFHDRPHVLRDVGVGDDGGCLGLFVSNDDADDIAVAAGLD